MLEQHALFRFKSYLYGNQAKGHTNNYSQVVCEPLMQGRAATLGIRENKIENMQFLKMHKTSLICGTKQNQTHTKYSGFQARSGSILKMTQSLVDPILLNSFEFVC